MIIYRFFKVQVVVSLKVSIYTYKKQIQHTYFLSEFHKDKSHRRGGY